MSKFIASLNNLKIKILQVMFTRKYRKSFRFWEHIYQALSRWQNDKGAIQLRLTVIVASFLFFYIIIGVRVIGLASNKNSADFRSQMSAVKTSAQKRKEIIDRNGSLLAVNLSTASLYANPKKLIDPQEAVTKLLKIIPNLEKNKLMRDLKSDRTFIWIKRDLTPKEQYAIHNLGIPGFYFEKEYKRVYTYGNLLSHTLGFVGRDDNGLAGVEKYFDKYLTNQDMSVEYAKKDKPLQLSIDVRVQSIVSEELDRSIKEFNALGGVGIVADAKTGEVLALVNKPDFDPHHPSHASDIQLFNKATLGAYEVGSVFKAITLAVGFDSGKVTLNDVYDLNAKVKIAKFTVKDYHKKEGWRTVPEIFMYSSNIGTAQIVLEVGKKIFKSYLQKLGLFDQTHIELPEKATPLYPSEKRWSDLDTVTMSYGHCMSVSPLHVVQAILPAVNGGYFHPLTLVKKDKNNEPELHERVFKETTSFNINKLFRLVVEKGTGKKAEVKGFLVGGKTGTANKAVLGKYSKTARLSSFISAFPMTDPKYVIFVMLDEPKGTKETFGYATAGFTAAPTTGRIVSRLAPLYGIKPLDEESDYVKKILHIDYKIDEEI
ncbi:MAG: penicillin-binding protein [Rickettsiaceae bacterium]|jgi:cell division protein FtsI (penicillin-binding protein 3)|nr:penicillin-binding protein [Rickettsiaceae bacterium]